MNSQTDSTKPPVNATGTLHERRSKVFTLLSDAQDHISVVADLLTHKSKSFIAVDPVVTVLKAAMTMIDEISIELDEGEEKL